MLLFFIYGLIGRETSNMKLEGHIYQLSISTNLQS